MSAIITIFIILTLVLGALIGFLRGTKKSVSRVIILAIAIAMTFAFARPLAKAVSDIDLSFLNIVIRDVHVTTLDDTALEALYNGKRTGEFCKDAPIVEPFVRQLPILLFSIFTFILLFFFLWLISWIVSLCVAKPVNKLIDKIMKHDGNPDAPASMKSRLGGLGIGLLCSILVVCMTLTPILGTLAYARTGVQAASTRNSKTIKAISGAVSELDKNFLVNLLASIGAESVGKAYLKGSSKIVYEGETIYLTDEIDRISLVYATLEEKGVIEAFFDESSNEVYRHFSDVEFTRPLLTELYKSRLFTHMAPATAAFAARSVVILLDLPETKKDVFNNMWGGITETAKGTDVDYEMIRAYIAENGYPEDLPADARLMMEAVVKAGEIASEQNASVKSDSFVFEDMSSSIETVLGLYQSVYDILANNTSGDAEALKKAAASIMGAISTLSGNEYTEEQILAFAQDLESRFSPLSDTSGSNPLSLVSDPETFKTNVPTGDDLFESINSLLSTGSENIDALAQTISALSGLAADINEGKASGESVIQSLSAENVQKLGEACDSSPEMSSALSTVLNAVGASETNKGNEAVGSMLNQLSQSVTDGNNLATTAPAVLAAAKLADSLQKGTQSGESGNDKSEVIINNFNDLVYNLSSETLPFISNFVNANTLTRLGVPAKYAGSVTSCLNSLLMELLSFKLSNTDETAFNTEASFVVDLYSIAYSGGASLTADDVLSLIDYANQSVVVSNTIISIGSSFDPFGVSEKLSGEKKAAYAETINTTTDSGQVAAALCNLLGID